MAAPTRVTLTGMLSARRGFARWDWTDWTSYVYLVLGTLLMFGPVAWLLLSSVKSPSGLVEFPPHHRAKPAIPQYRPIG